MFKGVNVGTKLILLVGIMSMLTIILTGISLFCLWDTNMQFQQLLSAHPIAGMESVADAIEDQARAELMSIFITAIVLIVITASIGVRFTRKISRRIHVIGMAADEIAEGDLTKVIKITNMDEIGFAAQSFEKMRKNVHSVLSDIQIAAAQVAAGSKNVSDASIALSQGATEQASSVEELSASITEIASQTKMNAESANKANELTEQAQNNARAGDADMKEMLTAMEEINASSTSISKIIKVIDEIAFQTNILALNAAVEAARAGQHGKGFAVVAEEVRNLAARSAKAAKETTDMIESSIIKVNGGREIAHKTAEALQIIVTHVTQVAGLVGSIAKASNEQNAALEQINQGVLQVSQVVQANSATSEESAAASEELSAQADLLETTVDKFKLMDSVDNVNKTKPAQSLKPSSKGRPKSSGKTMPQRIALTEEEGFGKY